MTAPIDLSGPSHPPAAGGPPRELIVLLHGVGADGADLISLAPLLAQALPHAEFLAPNAPFPCDMAPFGYQWFSLLDRSPAMMWAEIQASGPILDAWLDRQLAARDLTDSRLALVGFSQGTMMALHVAPRRARACAAVVGFSGALLGPEALMAEARSRPPTTLIHGDADPVVPFAAMGAAQAALAAAEIPAEAHRRPGLAHGIDETGIALAARALRTGFAP